jgi:glycerate kinase
VRVLIAPDCFTGTLTATQAAEAMAQGWRDGAPHDELDQLPLSDGGPGFVDVLHGAMGGDLVTVTVSDPLGREVPAAFLLTHGDEPTAYVESAAACGLHLLAADERDPGITSTYGVGQLVLAALESGARRIVVNGYSMGGSIALSFLLHSGQANAVAAVILDAPMLDFRETVEFRAPDGVPTGVLRIGEWIAGIRFDIDWTATDYAARAADYRTPMLIFQGSTDRSVPPAKAHEFAAARPDLVTLIETNAAHVRSWNENPQRYEAAIRAVLH